VLRVDTISGTRLDAVLAALANHHRRDLVRSLGLQPHSISQLAKQQGLSLPAIHKHIVVLEDAGLVVRRKQGRTNYLVLDPRSLGEVQEWLFGFHTYWGSASASFENYTRFLEADDDDLPTLIEEIS
jgi:DNA-binding transcriptional ArsR family regulator